MAKAKTKKPEPQTELKEWNLNPGQFLLFNNDKGDNPQRPDLRGQICLPDGRQARLSAWKKWTITNTMKLEGVMQEGTRHSSEPVDIGLFKLFASAGKNGPVMVGTAKLHPESPPMAMTLYRQTAKDGATYFSGYFNEIQQERVDPLATEEPAQDDLEHDELA